MKISPILRRIRSHAAETIAEVIIATIVLSTGGLAAATIVVMAINVNAYAEERIVAYNFAREGVEAFRNFRDTNWLRFPGSKKNCWLTLDASNSNDCPPLGSATTLTDGDYIVSLEIDNSGSPPFELFKWQITEEDPNTEDEILYAHEMGGQVIYTHDVSLGGVAGTPSKYSRVVTVDVAPTEDSMEVTSIVTWDFKGQTKSVTFVDQLSNY